MSQKSTEKLNNDNEQNVVAEVSFDWNNLDELTLDEKDKDLDKYYKDNLSLKKNNELIEGEITQILPRDIAVDIGEKFEGIISVNEFNNVKDLKIGDKIDVIIEKREDKNGQVRLSHRKALVMKSWKKANEAFDSGEIIKGLIKCRTRGGMIVGIFDIEAFLPGSQIDVNPVTDYDKYVGKIIELKVVKINHEFNNIVVSHKNIIETDIENKRKEIISKLEIGQVLQGSVKNMTNYGVFVDLGGIDGLIHITDLSWKKIIHPSDILELGQEIEVVVLGFDDSRNRIQLGVKQLESHPWDKLDKDMKVGDKIKGKVIAILDYGIFIEVADNIEGLVHISEMSWSTYIKSAEDIISVGDEVEAAVILLDREAKKMSLSMKQLTKDPWIGIEAKYKIGTKHKGIVRNITDFGVFVELEDGIDGLLHISDLSWNRSIKKPFDYVKLGQDIEVKVLGLDLNSRRLSLGHKQLLTNPWDEYENIYTLGSTTKAIVKDLVKNKGLIVLLDSGLEAFVPLSNAKKKDGTTFSKGEVSEFKVIEFNKKLNRIILSHTEMYKEGGGKTYKRNSNKGKSKKSGVVSTQKEKITLGSIQALSKLKEGYNNDKSKSEHKKSKSDESKKGSKKK